MQDRERATSMRRNSLSEPDDMSPKIEAVQVKDGIACIYDNRNYGVGSVITNPDGRKFVCSNDGTWQITKN